MILREGSQHSVPINDVTITIIVSMGKFSCLGNTRRIVTVCEAIKFVMIYNIDQGLAVTTAIPTVV